MESLAGDHNVICTRKIIMIEAVAEVNIVFFLVHITSCSPTEEAVNVLLSNQLFYN